MANPQSESQEMTFKEFANTFTSVKIDGCLVECDFDKGEIRISANTEVNKVNATFQFDDGTVRKIGQVQTQLASEGMDGTPPEK